MDEAWPDIYVEMETKTIWSEFPNGKKAITK